VTENREALETLRIDRNMIERAMSGLRPSDDSPLYRDWEDAMERLGRMHREIIGLLTAGASDA